MTLQDAAGSSDDGASNDAAPEGASSADASSPDSTVSDASPPDASPDGSPSDASPDGSPYDGSPDGSPGDAAADAEGGIEGPTLVQSGSTLNIEGITNDGYVVYFDSTSQSYYANSVHGGSAVPIYTVPPTSAFSYPLEIVNSVFVFDAGSNNVSRLTLWSAGLAQPVTLTTSALASRFFSAWASDDGKHIAYLQVASSGTIGGIYGANADGSNPTLLVGNINTANTSGRCFPLLTFRGGYAVASYCASNDAGTTRTVEAFSINDGWAPTLVVPDAVFTRTIVSTPPNAFYFPFAVDPDGGQVIVASSTSAGGALQVFSIDGGGATVLDPNVPMAPGLSLAGGLTNPWYALYTTDAGALNQAYASNPAPRTLVDGGVTLLDNISLDGQSMVVSSGANARGLVDISVVSTVNPGPPLTVATSAQYSNLGLSLSARAGGAFTTDGQYAVVYTNLTQATSGQTLFYVRSMGIAPPYAARVLSNGYAVDVHGLTGSKVLVADNFQDTDGGAGSAPRVDLDVVDATGNALGKPIVTGLNSGSVYAVSADRTLVIYAIKGGLSPGIYVAPVP
jgi:hypothetical protein